MKKLVWLLSAFLFVTIFLILLPPAKSEPGSYRLTPSLAKLASFGGDSANIANAQVRSLTIGGVTYTGFYQWQESCGGAINSPYYVAATGVATTKCWHLEGLAAIAPVSITAGACLSVTPNSPLINNGEIDVTLAGSIITASTYTITATDGCKVLVFNNASGVAVSIGQAAGDLGSGFAVTIQNEGTGTVTITPSISTINGATSLPIAPNTGCTIVSLASNYHLESCTAIGGSGLPLAGGTMVGQITDGWGSTSRPLMGFNTLSGIAFPAANVVDFIMNGGCFSTVTASSIISGSCVATAVHANNVVPRIVAKNNNGSYTAAALAVMGFRAGATIPTGIYCEKSNNSTMGSHTAMGSADNLCTLRFEGSDGSKFVLAAAIDVDVCGSVATDQVPGCMRFYTANAAGTKTLAMAIDKLQHVGFFGPVPTLSGCGTGASLGTGSTDSSGTITEGTGATGCTLTFASPYTSFVNCVVQSKAGLAFTETDTLSALALTNVGALSGTKLTYSCHGQ